MMLLCSSLTNKMINLYSGTPGSGKSFHVCNDIYDYLKFKRKNVIANFPIQTNKIKNIKGRFVYKTNDDLTIDYLLEFNNLYHKRNKENQTLIVIDEAGIKFNSRLWQDKGRLEWLNFFSQHRKFGYEIILISQSDLMLDKQIRTFIEVNHIHRKMANNGKVGLLLSPLCSFVDIKYWYGMNVKLGVDFLHYSKKIADLYDSYMLFDNGV